MRRYFNIYCVIQIVVLMILAHSLSVNEENFYLYFRFNAGAWLTAAILSRVNVHKMDWVPKCITEVFIILTIINIADEFFGNPGKIEPAEIFIGAWLPVYWGLKAYWHHKNCNPETNEG